IERLSVANRAFLFTNAVPNPFVADTADHLPIAQFGWHLDSLSVPTAAPMVSGDFGTGDLFTILPNGNVAQVPTGAIASCLDSNLPAGYFCREVLIHNGVPCPGPGPCPGGTSNQTITNLLPTVRSTAVTIWVRVIRVGETFREAAVQSQVIVQ